MKNVDILRATIDDAKEILNIYCVKSNNERQSIRPVPNAHFFSTKEGQPTVVYLLNQGFCNAKCSYCYVNKTTNDKAQRSLNQAYVDILNLQHLGYKVILRGTEILLNPEYLSLFRLVNQTYLQTNGLIIAENPQILSSIKDAAINHIIFTYPYIEDEISSISKTVVEKAINYCFKNFGITLSIIITKTYADNLMLLEKACQAALNLGARAIKFIRLMPINPEHITLSLNSEQSKIVLSELHRLKSKYDYNDLIIQTPGCFGMFSYRRLLNKEKYSEIDLSNIYDCPAGIKYFVIDAKNDIYPCLYLMGKKHKMGRYGNNMLKLLQTIDEKFWGKLRTEECPAFEFWTIKCNPLSQKTECGFHIYAGLSAP